ncbi:MAG: nucleoside kinase [Anaerolineae bacterium UTCFX1]|jgi:uridine kinase|nr:MAG: nucleoside kinase [Anaerolineae bacterium UTCFX1]
MPFKLVQPRDEVEIHLPDGRVLSGPRGAAVGEFLSAIEHDSQFVGAIINGDLRELTFPITMDARVDPVTMSTSDGTRIYRRSLAFLLEVAFEEKHPQASLSIDHSVASGGFYCEVKGRKPLTQPELDALKDSMRALVEADLPFERKEVPLQEATEYFFGRAEMDKIRLLKYRHKDYLTLYRLKEYMDYHHGYMTPSTGYLQWFDLVLAGDGFILLYPNRQNPNELLPTSNHPKLLATFLQYGGWLEKLGISNVGALNDALESGRGGEIVLVSEALHEQRLAQIAYQVAERVNRTHLILVSGPSSAGKTTFAKRLMVQLLALGISPFPLELDNYFLPRHETPLDETGKPDFEALAALDLPLLADHLQKMIRSEETQLPRYNFKTGLREEGESIRLTRGQPIILEGIHGLDPLLIPENLRGEAFRIYISALTQLNLDRHNRISTTDTRLLRRIVRDARERGYTAQQTISRWESVRHGEVKHIFPFQENADVMFNSALVYEMAALKPLAEPLLRQVQHGEPEFIEAKRLLAFLEWFISLDTNFVPETSILREFLGGSILKDFTVWKK